MKEKIYKKAYTAQEKLNALNLWKAYSTVEFVAHRYHCSIRILYKWRKMFNGSIESLKNHYHAPYTKHPNSHTENELRHIYNLIKRNPHIGLNELYGKLRTRYGYKRNFVSLYRVLKKKGWFISKNKRQTYKPQHYDTPRFLGVKWQLDVKYVPKECYVGVHPGEFRFYQYTMIDEATRERFIYPYLEQNAQSTVDFVKKAINYFKYKPKQIQTDNGQEFTFIKQTKNDKEHLLDRFCRLNKIIHKLIKPRTPRHNGKVERSHRNDNERFYKWLKFYSFADLQKQMLAYLKRSNNIPSRTLKWLTPMELRKKQIELYHSLR